MSGWYLSVPGDTKGRISNRVPFIGIVQSDHNPVLHGRLRFEWSEVLPIAYIKSCHVEVAA